MPSQPSAAEEIVTMQSRIVVTQNEKEEIRMNRHALWLLGMTFGLSSILVLGSGYVQAQTPNQVMKWDLSGTFPVDSAINETGGLVGIGGANVSNSVLQIFGQDGLRISGYEPNLILEDTNAGTIAAIASAFGDIDLVPHSFF